MVSGTEVKELEVTKTEPILPAHGISLGFSDYTTERKELFKNLTPEDVTKGIEEMRKRK